MNRFHGLILLTTLCLVLAECGGSGNSDSPNLGTVTGLERTRINVVNGSFYTTYRSDRQVPAFVTVHVYGSGLGRAPYLTLSDPATSKRVIYASCSDQSGDGTDLACDLFSAHLDEFKANLGKPYVVRVTDGTHDAGGIRPTLTFYTTQSQ